MKQLNNYISEKLYVSSSYKNYFADWEDMKEYLEDKGIHVGEVGTLGRNWYYLQRENKDYPYIYIEALGDYFFITDSENSNTGVIILYYEKKKYLDAGDYDFDITEYGDKKNFAYEYSKKNANLIIDILNEKDIKKKVTEKLYIGKNFKIDDKIFHNIMDICKREHKNLKSEELDKIVKDWIEKNNVEEFFIMVNEPQWFDLEKKYSKQELEHIVRSGAFADTAYKTICKEENKDTVIKGICTIYSNGNTIIIDYGGDDFYVIKKQRVQQ